MRYFLIAGEASGDLHAAHLIRALRAQDPQAEFRCFGGDLMQAEGAECLTHYRDLAFMGFIPVLLHLPTILRGLKRCKEAIREWQPHCVILVDYPGFNLRIAEFVRKEGICPVYYYISPKIWAWKERRIHSIRRNVDRLFSILPFEVDFFEGKHRYPITYVGNPTLDEVFAFQQTYSAPDPQFYNTHGLDAERPIIALLAGSRQQEIRDNLLKMCQACTPFVHEGYQIVLAGAPSISPDFYASVLSGLPLEQRPKIVSNATYQLLSHSRAALVTSGTATLETALFGVPQVVCYHTPLGWLVSHLRRFFLKVRYISLVNLIADQEVVPELVADGMTVERIHNHLAPLLAETAERQAMLEGYSEVRHRLGEPGAPQHTALAITTDLRQRLVSS